MSAHAGTRQAECQALNPSSFPASPLSFSSIYCQWVRTENLCHLSPKSFLDLEASTCIIMANSYKALKEDFVSNLSGGGIPEINLVTAVGPVRGSSTHICPKHSTSKLISSQAAYLLWAALQSQHSFFRSGSLRSDIADFLLNVGGLVLATTVYSSMPNLLLCLLLAPATLILALPPSEVPSTRPSPSKKADGGAKDLNPFPYRPFLAAYRGGMLVITCICILAVDFKAFPRRFAKVETWGTSLMDIGVGSFVFAAGLASSKTSLKNRLLSNDPSQAQPSFLKGVSLAIRQALPLFILGLVRLVSVKNLDYAEHVSEYGIHWNFFFTMAMLPLSLCFLQPLLSALPGPVHGYTGLLIAGFYELALQGTNLKAWALTAPREGLLAQNKEGVVSWVGYLAIFLLGMETGGIVLPRMLSLDGVLFRTLRMLGIRVGEESPRILLLASLALCSAAYSLFLLPFYTPRMFPWLSIPISRRLANGPYVLWIAAFNTAQLFLYALVESFVFPSVFRASSDSMERKAAGVATPRILDDFNSGGLLAFIFANLGTGLVNLSVDTLSMNNRQAVCILVIYMAALTFLARNLRGVKLKL